MQRAAAENNLLNRNAKSRALLAFRQLRPLKEELETAKRIYENAWGCGITISTEQLRAQIENFSEGQVVGCNESGRIVSMINMLVGLFNKDRGFSGGYDKITANRTFSNHIPLSAVHEKAKEMNRRALAIAYCVSIVVDPAFANRGCAVETLNYAIDFAENNGLIAVPYSAPRGFAKARQENPDLDIIDYLHLTKPSKINFENYLRRISELNEIDRIRLAFGGTICRTVEGIYNEIQQWKDSLMDPKNSAYLKFLEMYGEQLQKIYGREMTIEDFCLLTGRRLFDPVMRLHVDNGARFIRDGDGKITAVFEDSRPEDAAALGYNILLTYRPHPLLGNLSLQ